MSRLRPRAWSKSNSSRDLRAGNRAARMRPSPPWDSRAATSRCRQATRNSSWVQASVAGPLGQPGHRLAQRRRLQRPGQERQLGGQVPVGRRRSSGGHHATGPSAGRSAEGGVVVGQSAGPPPRGSRRPGAAARPGSRRSSLAAATCSGSVMVWCLAQTRAWSATSRPSQITRTRCQVGDDLDPAADHRRVHRVVVAVQPHVVVPRQPGAEAASRSPAATGGSASIAARSAAIRSVGRAAQRPPPAGVRQRQPARAAGR